MGERKKIINEIEKFRKRKAQEKWQGFGGKEKWRETFFFLTGFGQMGVGIIRGKQIFFFFLGK